MEKNLVENNIASFVKALEEAVAEGWAVDYTKDIAAKRLAGGFYRVSVVKEEKEIVETESVGATSLVQAWALKQIEEAEDVDKLVEFAKMVGVEDWEPKNTLGLSRNSLRMKLGLNKKGS